MKIELNINSILIYSEINDKYFFTLFKDKLNVIYGKNTAGKSTLIQLIFYCFGINDNKIKLTEILNEEIFVRIDCILKKGSKIEEYSFIRQDETLIIKDNNGKILRFNGIGSDNSAEHIKLKKYFNKLFDFNLFLESNTGISDAPIETLFLPYYVSQEVGWVYLRKSFSNLNFYKNFKEDFLDYYLGIENISDREKKREIEIEIRGLQQQITFFTNIEREQKEFEISRIIDKSLSGKANEFVESLSNSKDLLLNHESEYIKISNKLTFYNQRLSVVSKVKRNHESQFPGIDYCPTCAQTLPKNLEMIYSYYQSNNDTKKIQSELKVKIKNYQSMLNSLNTKIATLRINIKTNHQLFSKYTEQDINLESWIENKANIKLYDNLIVKIGELQIKLDNKKEELKVYKTDDDILIERQKKNHQFKQLYLENNIKLGLPKMEDERFYNIYEISSFPFQGTQLHLAVLSYHFAFNKLLTETNNIHRLPFILDSVFKEDLDGGNKINILKFINSKFPKDTQTILSIADDKNINSMINNYSDDIFKDNAHLICIGDGINERALLKENDNELVELIEDSYIILESI